mgnify:CR=1 FL=1
MQAKRTLKSPHISGWNQEQLVNKLVVGFIFFLPKQMLPALKYEPMEGPTKVEEGETEDS